MAHTYLKRLIFCSIFSSFLLQVNAQILPDTVFYERLYYLCKVWGHAKYYHPEIARGNIDWDTELVNMLEEVRRADSDEAFNEQVFNLLQKAGPVTRGIVSRPEVPDSLNNNLDLDWIKNPIFSPQVQMRLDSILQGFGVRRNVYVDEAWPGGAPTFTNDNKFFTSDIAYPEEAQRILAVFRYWNIIHYFFPYKYIMDQHWDSTLVQFIPPIVEASNTEAYHLAFKEFTTYINDSHAFFSSPPFRSWDGQYYTPFEIRYIEGETVVTKVLGGTRDIKVGDVIREIDGREIKALRERLRKYTHGSNEVIIQRNINSLLMWGNAGTFSVKIENEEGTQMLSFDRNSENFSRLNTDNSPRWREEVAPNGTRIGVVDMGRLEVDQIPNLFRDFSDTDAIIFDIRSYPQGTLWTLVNYLFADPINIANFTVPDITFPGRLRWSLERIGQGSSNPYSGRIAILFDERTQSQAEYTVMGLEQFPGALKIGSTTAAADGNVANIFLPGNIVTVATFLGTYYPDFTPTQRIGIIPDMEVHPTIEGIRAGRDEVMEAAIQALDGTLTSTTGPVQQMKLQVFPNPGIDVLRYSLPKWEIQGAYELSVFDVKGGRYLKKIGVGNVGEIAISSLPAGVYILKAQSERQVATQKFLKF
ncbi:MAG: T9SS type A sorting domain-containing protein [Bacteroidota bacterium]